MGERGAKIVMRLGVGWKETDRRPLLGSRLVGAAKFQESRPAVAMGLDIIRVQTERRFIMTQGLGGVAGALQFEG